MRVPAVAGRGNASFRTALYIHIPLRFWQGLRGGAKRCNSGEGVCHSGIRPLCNAQRWFEEIALPQAAPVEHAAGGVPFPPAGEMHRARRGRNWENPLKNTSFGKDSDSKIARFKPAAKTKDDGT